MQELKGAEFPDAVFKKLRYESVDVTVNLRRRNILAGRFQPSLMARAPDHGHLAHRGCWVTKNLETDDFDLLQIGP